MVDLREVRREAVFKAEMLLADLDIGPSRRIAVFDAIEDAGVWLTFEPLDRLYGWYQRVDHAAGVVINSSHPAPLQRFTAAHELGHHVLGHSYSLDDENSIVDGGRGTDPLEVAAHAFAANLLMPLASVEYHLERLGLERQRPAITPVAAYRLSVELGVSYAAAAVQLASLNKITWTAAAELRRARPRDLKRELVGRAPDQARAAVWLLGDSDDGRHLNVDLGDELNVRVDEVRSSGLRWMPAPVTMEGFALLADWLQSSDDAEPRRYGAPQARHLVFKAVRPGPHSIVVDLRPPWLTEAQAERRVGIAVDVEAARTSDLGKGVSINQQPQLIAA